MDTDEELLRRYAANRCEQAFAEIVRRHLGLVYGVALRQLGGNAALAEDVTQAVFTGLAAKAATLPRIRHLAGWLYGTARFTALHTVRAERRRQQREQNATTMHDLLATSDSAEPQVPQEVLEAVLDKLSAEDREAVLLRFFEGRSFQEVGAALGTSDDAARVRVNRALEKIRTLFARHGITSSTAAVSAILAGQAVAAPPALALSVSAMALTSSTVLGAMAGTKPALITLMMTTKTTAWVTGTVALLALGVAGFEHQRASGQEQTIAQLTLAREHVAAALKQADQRAALDAARASQAEPRAAQLDGNLHAVPTAKPMAPAPRFPAKADDTLEAKLEKMARMKPLLEAGQPIKGAVIVFANGQPVQRPVALVMGKETRIESVDDGTYTITPKLNSDGSVAYTLKVTRRNPDGTEQKPATLPTIIQTPWEGFTFGDKSGRILAFDPDGSAP